MDHSLDHQKDTFASSSRNAGTRSRRIFFTHSWSFLYVKAAWLLRYIYLVTGVSASIPTNFQCSVNFCHNGSIQMADLFFQS